MLSPTVIPSVFPVSSASAHPMANGGNAPHVPLMLSLS